MINLIAIILIYGLGATALYFYEKSSILERKNEGLRDRIKWDKEWYEFDKKISCNLARVNERYEINREQFQKQCDEFTKQCEETNMR